MPKSTKDQIEAALADLGQTDFAELAQELGCTEAELEAAMTEAAEEDWDAQTPPTT